MIKASRRTSSGRRPRIVAGIAAAAVMGLLLTACGGSDPATTETDAAATASESSDTAASPAESEASAPPLNVGIFVDNAFGDGDFFDQAAMAEDQLVSEFGANVTTYEGQLEAQNFGPLLQDAADNNDLVFVLGFEAIDAMVKAAQDNPDTTYVFIDAVIDVPEIVSAEFRTAEGCFMAGALAASANQAKGSNIAGFIGGVDAPVIKNCESGYTQGVAAVDPAMAVSAKYAGSFVDPAKGSEISISFAKEGAYSVFAYAGLTGAGAFDAAKAGEDIAPIGVVADKSVLAPGKSTGSLEMGVDSVILDTTSQYVAGTLEKGTSKSYGFDNGGWNMVYNSELVSQEQVDALNAIQEQLVNGEITLK